MLSRRYRLRNRHDFKRVYKAGKGSRGQLMVIRSLANGMDTSRAAVVVSTKVAKRATVRNRLRRQIHGHLSRLWPQLAPGQDIIISLNAGADSRPLTELTARLEDGLKKLGVLG